MNLLSWEKKMQFLPISDDTSIVSAIGNRCRIDKGEINDENNSFYLDDSNLHGNRLSNKAVTSLLAHCVYTQQGQVRAEQLPFYSWLDGMEKARGGETGMSHYPEIHVAPSRYRIYWMSIVSSLINRPSPITKTEIIQFLTFSLFSRSIWLANFLLNHSK